MANACVQRKSERQRVPWENKRTMACAGHGEPEPEAESVPEPEPCVRIQLHRLRRARTMRRCDMVLLLCHMIMPISMVNIDIVCFSRSAGRKFSRKEFHTHTP